MNTAEPAHAPHLVKCVVWDLDNTLWQGIAAEGMEGATPLPDLKILDIISLLEGRGIISSVASRNDPSQLETLLAQPLLQGRFVAPQVSWEPKSVSLRRIASHLNLGLDAIAFVDDSPFERAEVSYMLPDVLVLAPGDLEAALASPAFNPGRETPELKRRAAMYREEEERKLAEASFAGSRGDFLRWCDMHLVIAPATTADLPRIIELTERTHQLNSTGRRYTPEEVHERVVDPRWLVPVAALTDRFGDYGIIGAAIVDTRPPAPHDVWLAELVMLSCRVEGRGIPAALLLTILRRARAAGLKSLQAVYRVSDQNLPLRLLFRQLGFSKASGESLVTVSRDLSEPIPGYPEWLQVAEDGPHNAC